MRVPETYFDNCATTPVLPEIAQTVEEMMVREFGNPSSLHFLGGAAYQRLSVARSQVAQVLGAPTERIFFTSGGTEANNLALTGLMWKDGSILKKKIVTTAIEHDSVLTCAARLALWGCRLEIVKPGPEGILRAEDIAAAVDADTALVSVMTVNNETGEVVPIQRIVELVKAKNPQTLVHTDFVQGFGKIPLGVWQTGVDLLSLSGHKIHAPKGIGALYLREGVQITPLQLGGHQESGVRPGTENVPLACGLGAAAHRCMVEMGSAQQRVQALNDRLKAGLLEIPDACINSPADHSPYILNVSFLGHQTDELVAALSLRHIYLSGSSACTRGARSHVLQAMGLPEERIASAIRIGLSDCTTEAEIDRLVCALQELCK